MPTPFGSGIRFLNDAHQRFYRPGLPCYLRIKNQVVGQGYVELGFQLAVTGAKSVMTSGYTDILIDPPVEASLVPLHDIGLNQVRLMFGATKFSVSHTFVINQMLDRGLSDYYQVFRDPAVIGINYNSRLFSIESITHEEASGEIIAWTLLCNAAEAEVNAT